MFVGHPPTAITVSTPPLATPPGGHAPSPPVRRAPAVRVLKAGLQAVALVAAAWVFVRTAQPNWGALTAVRVTIDWSTLALASIVWLASFLFLVWLWTQSLAWWQSRLGWRPGLR